jgi:hypothetical protein
MNLETMAALQGSPPAQLILNRPKRGVMAKHKAQLGLNTTLKIPYQIQPIQCLGDTKKF